MSLFIYVYFRFCLKVTSCEYLSLSFWLTSVSVVISRSSVLLPMALFHSSLWLSGTPSCMCTASSLFIHQLMAVWAVSVHGLLWNLLLWTWTCSCVCVPSRSVVSGSLRPYRLQPARLLCPWDSPGKNPGVGCLALLQGLPATEPASATLAGRLFIISAAWEA